MVLLLLLLIIIIIIIIIIITKSSQTRPIRKHGEKSELWIRCVFGQRRILKFAKSTSVFSMIYLFKNNFENKFREK